MGALLRVADIPAFLPCKDGSGRAARPWLFRLRKVIEATGDAAGLLSIAWAAPGVDACPVMHLSGILATHPKM